MIANAAKAASGQPAFCKKLHRKILYRAAFFVTLLACVVSLTTVVAAQEDRPQISPDERKVPRKKEVGPRALGVLRLTASGKATLVPITILMSGKFYDASAYKAAPVPMALESGTVYEGIRTGSSLGLFTVDGALHSTVANSLTPWIGTGKWLPAGAEVTKTTLKAEDVPVGIDTSDGPPRLSRSGSAAPETKPASDAPKAAPPSTTTTPQTTTPQTTTPASATPQTPAESPSGGTSGSGAGGSSQPAAGSTAPSATESKSSKTDDHPSDAAKESDNNSGAGDSNRPRLRRGKPVDPLPDEEVPGYSRLGSKPSAASAPAFPPTADAGKNAAAPPALVPVQLIPAISDATGPQPRSFNFEWLKSEEGERRQQMTDLAKQQLRAYLDAQAKGKIPVKPTGAHAQRKASKPLEPILENPRMVAYDLWTNNQPVMVFSAEAHMPPSPGTALTATDADLQYSIVLVARNDIYNNLHKLYVGVTDKYHLDITPRLELVDAVDADGDNRGELLFRETSDAGGGWLIYRASPDKLWKLFDSLNPE